MCKVIDPAARFPRLHAAHHAGPPTQEEDMESLRNWLRILLDREPTFGDMFAASCGTVVEDPEFQRAIAASLGEEDQWLEENPEYDPFGDAELWGFGAPV